MKTDDSNQAIAGILLQYQVVNGCKQLYLVKYYAKSLSTTQDKWRLHDEELFSIMDCFQKCRDWLAGVQVKVYTEHQGLQYINM